MRQPCIFILVGLFQYVLDAILFALLIGMGVSTLPSNIASRAFAAATGFVLNRYVTFEQRNETLRRFGQSLLRFILLFTAMTILSSLGIMAIEAVAGSANTVRIAAKLGVEAVLAVASFLLSRRWVFRN